MKDKPEDFKNIDIDKLDKKKLIKLGIDIEELKKYIEELKKQTKE